MRLITQFDHEFQYRGNTHIASVVVQCSDEMESWIGSVAFGSEEADNAYYARVESGELLNVCIAVKATCNGIEGSDYLGSCHVRAQCLNEDVMSTVNDHAMVGEAIADLIVEIANMKIKLDRF